MRNKTTYDAATLGLLQIESIFAASLRLDGLLAMFRQRKGVSVGMSVPHVGGCSSNFGWRIRERLAASEGGDGMGNTEKSED